MVVDVSDVRKILGIASKISKKVLIQVEGATCSGKSSFVSDVWTALRRRGIDIMIIEEAATKVLTENDNLLKQLISYPKQSEQWKSSKTELQKRVLRHQLESLEGFAENDAYTVALMDRGGASTAYHTIPLLSSRDKNLVEEICREIGQISRQIILLYPLGFLNGNSPRYQKTLEEIRVEHEGIKHLLDSWRLSYLEIASVNRDTRVKKGITCISSLLEELNDNCALRFSKNKK